MIVHKFAAFSDGSHRGACAAAILNDSNEIMAVNAARRPSRWLTAGAMELAGVSLQLDMAAELVEALALPIADTIELVCYGDNEPVMEMCCAANDPSVCTNMGASHLSSLVECVNDRAANFRSGGALCCICGPESKA